MLDQETIVAQATAMGQGGVGIIRLSGSLAKAIGEAITGKQLKPRQATFATFKHQEGHVLDEGVAIYFAGPHSFTGEDIVELQGHGGPVILQSIQADCLSRGARMARPGEFSERAFLNGKHDLAQAEAIADLIAAGSEQAAQSAVRSLQGAFSQQVNQLSEALVHLRIYVEAAIDFPEEEVDFLADDAVQTQLKSIDACFLEVKQAAKQGQLLRDGMHVVLVGKPNAGKSSLLNALAGRNSAIVTEVAGTTRDILKEHIHLDGMPLHLFDTAGLRQTEDQVEQEGIRRAWEQVLDADVILWLLDVSKVQSLQEFLSAYHEFASDLAEKSDKKAIVLVNKVDQSNLPFQADWCQELPVESFMISAKLGQGLTQLKDYLKAQMGYNSQDSGTVSARARHIHAIDQAYAYLQHGYDQLTSHGAGELLAEDLRMAHQALGEITGEFSSDDLLGAIFSSFCIGK